MVFKDAIQKLARGLASIKINSLNTLTMNITLGLSKKLCNLKTSN